MRQGILTRGAAPDPRRSALPRRRHGRRPADLERGPDHRRTHPRTGSRRSRGVAESAGNGGGRNRKSSAGAHASRAGAAASASAGLRRAIPIGDPGERSRPISFRAEGEYSEARRLFRKASAIARRLRQASGVSPNPSTRATTALNEAYLAAEMGDWAEAERLYRTSVDLWSKALGPDHPFVARGLDGLADVASSQGRFDAARRLYEQVLAMRRRTLGPRTRRSHGRSPAWPPSPGRPASRPSPCDSQTRPWRCSRRPARAMNRIAFRKRSSSEDCSRRARAGCTRAAPIWRRR